MKENRNSTKTVKYTRMTFDVPTDLKKNFKLKVTSEDLDIKETLCNLMQLYVDGKIKFNEK